jgi:hypothetical protein
VLGSYAASLSQRQEILHQAHYLTLVVALYKLAKAVKLQPDRQKIARIIEFIRETLPLIEIASNGKLNSGR